MYYQDEFVYRTCVYCIFLLSQVEEDHERETDSTSQRTGRAGVRSGEEGRRIRRRGDPAGVCVCV